MNTQTQLLLEAWQEARTRFTLQLPKIVADDLTKKLPPSPNSAGFILRHVCDVELLFAKNIFGAKEINVHASTLIDQCDKGKWTNLKELLEYQQIAFQALKKVIELQPDEVWQQLITTTEFGVKTKAQVIGRIISHTAYHAGQLAMILKYGV
ncbi:DinB family protein [Pedobacter panaciterrae]